MFPVLCEIGKLSVYSYGAMISLGVIVATSLSVVRARKEGISSAVFLKLILLVLICGLIAARSHIVFANLNRIVSNPLEGFKLGEGGAFYLGLLPAFIVGLLYVKKNKLSVLHVGDIIFTYLPLGHAIGRVGCFLGGCCYGSPTSLPWGVRFPKWSSVANGIAGSPAFEKHLEEGFIGGAATHSLHVHPTQLYSVLSNIIIFAVLVRAGRDKQSDGQILCMYVALYAVARLFIGFLRGDTIHVLFNMSLSQLFSIPLFIAGSAGMYMLGPGKKRIELRLE